MGNHGRALVRNFVWPIRYRISWGIASACLIMLLKKPGDLLTMIFFISKDRDPTELRNKRNEDIDRTIGEIDPKIYYRTLYDPSSPLADANGFKKNYIEAMRELKITNYKNLLASGGHTWMNTKKYLAETGQLLFQ
jgi:hypothetical protein